MAVGRRTPPPLGRRTPPPLGRRRRLCGCVPPRLHSCSTTTVLFCAFVTVADRTLLLLCRRRRVHVSRAPPFLPPLPAPSARAPLFLPHCLASVSATLCNSSAPPWRHPLPPSLSLQLCRLCILNLAVLLK
ncbi:hypothetical protein PIB30_004047 [Stylosanthes scabra]|uniref:Uncharacterized protein n=1 Tax=Stylosanthes scabra TaxID=79078 RepID=A0ABU6Y1Q8_9FABA|nr:hypothetical protein [Stylosanthes scabra]